MSAMAWFGAIMILLVIFDIVFIEFVRCDVLDATIVASSLASDGACSTTFWVGFEECTSAETKLICLFATLLFSAPHRQVFRPEGSTDLCIPRVHGS